MVKQGFEEANQLWESGSKGKPVNRGGDFGREVPCESTFEGEDLSPVSGCIGRIEEKFDVESCLGI